MKEKFIDHSFNAASLKLIEICNTILEEYRSQGYTLSLRQLYYQLVARDRVENRSRVTSAWATWSVMRAWLVFWIGA